MITPLLFDGEGKTLLLGENENLMRMTFLVEEMNKFLATAGGFSPRL